MCQSEQDQKDLLIGQGLRLAIKAECEFTFLDLLELAKTPEDFQKIVYEMESRVSHKRAWEEEIAGWYALKDRAGISTGD